VDLLALKTFVREHGIESSVFYGEQAFLRQRTNGWCPLIWNTLARW
jgi:hypothetical protein